jgi:hypothetical protein
MSQISPVSETANVDVLIQRLRAANAGGLREQAYQSLCGDAADALSRGYAQRPTEPHEATYLRGWNEAIEHCALIAEGFDAACNSPRMKLFEEAGLVIAVYKRDGEIGAAIRALADTSTVQPRERIVPHEDCLNCRCSPEEQCDGVSYTSPICKEQP